MAIISRYIISEKKFDNKIAPYLRKLSKVMKSTLNEFYDLDNKVETKERTVTYYLYNNTEVIASLDKDNSNMLINVPSTLPKKLINKLERLTKK